MSKIEPEWFSAWDKIETARIRAALLDDKRLVAKLAGLCAAAVHDFAEAELVVSNIRAHQMSEKQAEREYKKFDRSIRSMAVMVRCLEIVAGQAKSAGVRALDANTAGGKEPVCEASDEEEKTLGDELDYLGN